VSVQSRGHCIHNQVRFHRSWHRKLCNEYKRWLHSRSCLVSLHAGSLGLCLMSPVSTDSAFGRYFDELYEKGFCFTTGEQRVLSNVRGRAFIDLLTCVHDPPASLLLGCRRLETDTRLDTFAL
jgi:hypothetical protein